LPLNSARSAAATAPNRHLLVSALALVLAACAPDSGDPAALQRAHENTPAAMPANRPNTEETKLLVCAVNYPLQYFAERLAGDLADVALPSPPGVDPAHWKPSKAERGYVRGQCELILLNGGGYAHWTTKVSLPADRTIDTTSAVADRLITSAESSEPTWLDPTISIAQVRAVADALARERPAYASEFERRRSELEADLVALDARLVAISSGARNAPLWFPASGYEYLIRRYDLRRGAIEPPVPGLAYASVPAGPQNGLHPAAGAILPAAPSPETAAALKARKLAWAVVDPAAGHVPTGDFMFVMRKNADALASFWRDLGETAK
jgi:zinc transport system substrate-binding protein